MNILDIEIPYYAGNIKSIRPIGKVMIGQVLHAICAPKPSLQELVANIRKAPNENVKSELKAKLPGFTPSSVPKANGIRAHRDIERFTSILTLDFDKLQTKEAAETMKRAIYDEFPSVFAAWVSSSGKGCRFLVKIPLVHSVDEFKDYFFGFKECIEHPLTKQLRYPGYDTQLQNPVQVMYYSIDPNILVRSVPETFIHKKTPDIVGNKKPIYICDNSPAKLKAVYTIVSNDIEPIVGDGHPQLRKSAYKVGGYVASGYITEIEAIDLFHSHIDRNAYLSQKAKTYKKTATQMIKKGQNEPLTIN